MAAPPNITIGLSFNSIVVRLRQGDKMQERKVIDSFNSIVVRLRPQLKKEGTYLYTLFQFYSSSIKTIIHPPDVWLLTVVSIL